MLGLAYFFTSVLAQTRLNLPAWLGVGDALAEVASTAEGKADLRGMYEDWPFFATNIGKLHHCLYGSCDMFRCRLVSIIATVIYVVVG